MFSCSLAMNLALGLALWASQVRHSSAAIRRAATQSPLAPAVSLERAAGKLILLEAEDACSSLKNGNYRTAMARLQDLGFPTETVQDIVVGSINRRYSPRLLALRQRQWKFWEPLQRRKRDDGDSDFQRDLQARDLEAERNGLVQNLFGFSWASWQTTLTGRPDVSDKFTAAFSPATRPQAREVLAQFDEREREVIARVGGTLGLPERDELLRLHRQKIESLKQFASPQEIEEYEMRVSPAADDLRQVALVGFNPSEEEFRLIFRIRQEGERSLDSGAVPELSPGAPSAWQAHTGVEAQLEAALGESRYSDYRRCQDYTFRGLVELTDAFDVPTAAAVEVHTLREQVLQQTRTLQQSAAMNEQERTASLQRLRASAEKSVRLLLGEAAYGRYTQLQIGDWMARLDQP